MSNSIVIVLSALFLGAIVAVAISCRGSSTNQSVAAEIGPPESLADYLDRLQRSTNPHAFLIVADPETGDFVQFTASAEAVQIDFPVITPRQQELEPRVRQILEANGLRPETTTGTDGSRFLDADSTAAPENTAEIVRAIFRDAFGQLPTSFNYQFDGLESHAG
jgi:hypothetical protein